MAPRDVEVVEGQLCPLHFSVSVSVSVSFPVTVAIAPRVAVSVSVDGIVLVVRTRGYEVSCVVAEEATFRVCDDEHAPLGQVDRHDCRSRFKRQIMR